MVGSLRSVEGKSLLVALSLLEDEETAPVKMLGKGVLTP